jgi:DNA-binding transcriptional MerR regulator
MREMKRDTRVVNEEEGRRMLKIGDVSKRSGIGIEALRFYEKSGLLDKPSRTFSGYRVYGPEILERLAFIKQAQALGFSLDEIKRIIENARTGQTPCDEVREIVSRRLEELDERMREMRRYRKELAETLEEWNKVGRAPGHICGLIESSHVEHSAKEKKIKRAKRAKGQEQERSEH